MLSPDGQVGDIPQERVGDASSQGFKLAQDMLSPDGKPGVIPFDRVHDALAKGFKLSGAQPKPPEPDMQARGLIGNEPIPWDAEDRAHASAERTAAAYSKSFPLMAGGGMTNVAEGAEPLAQALASKVFGHLKRMLGLGKEIDPLNFEGLPGEQSAAEAAAAPEVESSTLPNKDTEALEEQELERNPDAEGVPINKEQAQKAVDEYFEAHPEKRPQQQTWKRGAKKGQLKTQRVFKDGQWHEIPLYK